MSSFPLSPRVLKGGIVLIDPTTAAVKRIVVLQYNPDTLTRTLQVQGVGGESGGVAEPLRLKGPPIETLKLEVEIDAADQLETPEQSSSTVQYGLQPQLAALETIVYPTSLQLQELNTLARAGVFEIAPIETPLALFVWSKTRVMPVRLTELSITEEAFDPALNPLRAKISLGMRVLSVNDLGFSHRGSSLYMGYHQQKEQLASSVQGALSALGLTGIP